MLTFSPLSVTPHLLWAFAESYPETEDYPAYRADKELLNPGSKGDMADAQLTAQQYFHMLRFDTDADRRTALLATIPDSGAGHPVPDAEICDQRIKLLKEAVNRGLDPKAKK